MVSLIIVVLYFDVRVIGKIGCCVLLFYLIIMLFVVILGMVFVFFIRLGKIDNLIGGKLDLNFYMIRDFFLDLIRCVKLI